MEQTVKVGNINNSVNNVYSSSTELKYFSLSGLIISPGDGEDTYSDYAEIPIDSSVKAISICGMIIPVVDFTNTFSKTDLVFTPGSTQNGFKKYYHYTEMGDGNFFISFANNICYIFLNSFSSNPGSAFMATSDGYPILLFR